MGSGTDEIRLVRANSVRVDTFAGHLESVFESLAPSPECGAGRRVFTTTPIPSRETHRIAKDSDGEPVILIAVEDDRVEGGSASTPIQLRHLTVEQGAVCDVTTDSGTQQRLFTLVACVNADTVLRRHFFRIIGAILVHLGDRPSSAEVREAVQQLIELFRANSSASQFTLQGLWAEAFVIQRSRNADALVLGWHDSLDERFDFAKASQRLEVKSRIGSERRHHLSFEQSDLILGRQVVFASVLLERSVAGVTVQELAERIEPRLKSSQAIQRLYRIMLAGTGMNGINLHEERYDLRYSEHHLRFYAQDAVPAIVSPIPIGVAEVKFVSDFTGAQALSEAELTRQGGLFEAMTTRNISRPI